MRRNSRLAGIMIASILSMLLMSACNAKDKNAEINDRREHPVALSKPVEKEPQKTDVENEKNKESKYVVHRIPELGISFKMKQELVKMAIFSSVIREYDDRYNMNRSIVDMSVLIDGIQVPVAIISVYEGEITMEEADEKDPMSNYITCSKGLTYMIQYSEEGGGKLREDQLDKYNDIMNNLVVEMRDKMSIDK